MFRILVTKREFWVSLNFSLHLRSNTFKPAIITSAKASVLSYHLVSFISFSYVCFICSVLFSFTCIFHCSRSHRFTDSLIYLPLRALKFSTVGFVAFIYCFTCIINSIFFIMEDTWTPNIFLLQVHQLLIAYFVYIIVFFMFYHKRICSSFSS